MRTKPRKVNNQITQSRLTKAFNAGKAAFQFRLALLANPYKHKSLAAAWCDGFMFCEERVNYRGTRKPN